MENEHAWPSILARALSPIRVINLGLEGVGPQHYLRVYETFGVTLQSRVLIVGLFARNDFWGDEMFDRWSRSRASGSYMVWRDFGRPKEVDFSLRAPIPTLVATLGWRAQLLARRSYFYNLALHVRSGAKRWRRSDVSVVQLSSGAPVELFPEAFKEKIRGAQKDQPEFQRVLEVFRRIQSIPKEHSTQTLLVFQPRKEEVYLPLHGSAIPDATAPLKEELNKLALDHVDLQGLFRERASQGEKLFCEVDGHPNATATR